MWKGLYLQTRILILLAALILTALAGGLVTVWHTDAIDSLLTDLIDQNVASFQAAEELESALLRQKGYVTYFFLDQNPDWLAKLQENHLVFLDWLDKAKASAYTPNMLVPIRTKLKMVTMIYAKAREQGNFFIPTGSAPGRHRICIGKSGGNSRTCIISAAGIN